MFYVFSESSGHDKINNYLYNLLDLASVSYMPAVLKVGYCSVLISIISENIPLARHMNQVKIASQIYFRKADFHKNITLHLIIIP